MKKIFVFLVGIIMFWGCGSQSDKKNIEEDTVVVEETALNEPEIEEENSETVSFNNPPTNLEEAKLFIKQFMPASRVDSFMNAMAIYESVKTDTALIKFYRTDATFIVNALWNGMLKSHPDVQYAGDSEPAMAWAWVKNFLPVRTECLSSEGESQAYKYLPDFLKKAKSTAGTLDDNLFGLLNAYYEDYDGVWLNIGYGNEGCDFCGYSTLGNGAQFELLKKILEIEKRTEFLDKELKVVVNSMVEYIGRAFKSSQKDVLNEIDSFLELKDSTRFDISKMIENRGKIANADSSYIFECTYEDFTNQGY